MRWKAIIVLLAIALSIVVPPSLSLTIADDGHSTIGTLDVCHSATPALSSNGEMPCVNECQFHPLHSTLEAFLTAVSPVCKPVSIAFQDERPPKH